MQVALSIKDLQKTYANQLHALKGIDLQVEQGDFFALLGSNGAGKNHSHWYYLWLTSQNPW